MEIFRLTPKRGYFFDGYTLLKGYISNEKSIYARGLSGKVIYSVNMYGFGRPWNHGYKYDNWDWRNFEYIPTKAFYGIYGLLEFYNEATTEEILMYLKLKEVMKSEDFKLCGIVL